MQYLPEFIMPSL